MFTRVMGGVIFLGIVATFAAAISYGLNWAGASLVVVFGLAASFILFAGLMAALNAILRPYRDLYDAKDFKERRLITNREIRNQNRVQFWTGLANLAIIGFTGYLAVVGLPLLFGTTISEVMEFFTTNPAGTFMAIQFLSILPMWVFLPVVYLFGFYGPFVIKVVFFDMRLLDRGSEDFNVNREDIIGHDQNIDRLERMLLNVRNWRDLKEFGILPERGALLTGPPGTGKTRTLLYLAGHFGMAMVFIASSISRQTFVGVAVLAMIIAQWRTKRHAKKNNNQVIVVIDEIDLLGKKRSSDTSMSQRALSFLLSLMPVGGNSGGDDSGLIVLMQWMSGIQGSAPIWYRIVRKRVNTLLDGLFIDEYAILPMLRLLGIKIDEPPRLPPWKTDWYDGGFFIGTTNRPQDIDEALRRDGRLSETLFYDLPNDYERELLVRYFLRKIPHASELDNEQGIAYIVSVTEGMPHSNIEGLIKRAWTEKLALAKKSQRKNQSAALTTFASATFGADATEDKLVLTPTDIIKARSDKSYGLARAVTGKFLQNMRRTAIHEAGHATVTEGMKVMLAGHETVTLPRLIHFSAKPRGRSLGRVESVPVVPVDTKWQADFDMYVRISLASYAAERVFFGETTSGGKGDLASATLRAILMYLFFGWGPRACTDEEWKKYAKLGKIILTANEHSALNLAREKHLEYSPFVRDAFGKEMWMNKSFVDEAFSGPLSQSNEREAIAVILGQAFVDAYRFILINKEKVGMVAQRLEEAGWEVEGPAVEALFNGLVFEPIYDGDPWPEVALKNPFSAGIRRPSP